jgi:hypothetical protein
MRRPLPLRYRARGGRNLLAPVRSLDPNRGMT